MKRDVITNYLIEKKVKSEVNVFPLFINCSISIFSLCFLVDISGFFHTLITNSLLEKLLLVIMGGLGVVFVVAMRYSFFLFVKSLAEKYELLLILGIKAKDFWRLVVKEYLLKVFLLGITVILFSDVLCNIISYIIFYGNINMKMVVKQFILTMVYVLLLYTIILLFTMLSIMYNRRKKNLIDFFEQFLQDKSKKYIKYKNKNGQFWKPFFGITFTILSFVLLINFRVDKMIIAVFLNLLGAFLFIHSDGVLIRKIVKKFKKLYYTKILVWTDFLYQYRINSHLIFILYTLNFFLVYFMGGLMVSSDAEQDSTIKYPYEIVIYSDSNICPQNSYYTLLIDVEGYGSATAISNRDYNQLKRVKYNLRRGEVSFIDEREEEDNVPLDEKEIEIISRDQDENLSKYTVKNVEWDVIFGRNIFSELNGIVVFNDEDFDLLLKSKVGTEKYIFLSAQAIDSGSLMLNAGAECWNRTQQVEKENIEHKVLIALIYIISLSLILEGQAFIFTKQIVNLKEECYRYNVLRELGIKKRELRKIIEKKIRGILLIPGAMAIISGIIFFAMDIYQNPSGVTRPLLLNYALVISFFAFAEILGCCLVDWKVKKIYMKSI